jgi:uncharacterized protein YcbK (DUF882 family)
MNRNLSPHFLESEFTCNCGCKTTFVDSRLLKGLEELRNLVKVPIKILSGYRCIRNNAEAGGGKNSQHLYGKAVDLIINGMSVPQMYEAALQIPEFFEGGIGIYPDNKFIHVDVRLGKARWARIKKKKKDVYVSIDEGLKACSTK